jgi:hypothetical protein
MAGEGCIPCTEGQPLRYTASPLDPNSGGSQRLDFSTDNQAGGFDES